MDNAARQSGSTIIPGVRYRDAPAAIEWLVKVLAFTKQAVYPGPNGTVAHAQLTYGGGMLMLSSVQEEGDAAQWIAQPDEVGGRETAALCLVVPDCNPLYAAAKAAGAEIVRELREPDHGGWEFACKDPEGHVWWVGTYDPWAPPAASAGPPAEQAA